MITADEITAAGSFTKTHGLHGELHALLDIDADYLLHDPCFILDIDGIFVPFFAESVRPKGHCATLIKPEGVDSEQEAKLFVGKTIYVNRKALATFEHQNAGVDEPGGYADDFIGFTINDSTGTSLGEIVDIETSTANTLFIVRTPSDKTLYVPVADEFVTAIDTEAHTITMQLPDGLLDLNN